MIMISAIEDKRWSFSSCPEAGWAVADVAHRSPTYSTAAFSEPVRILVCRGHETITEITSYDRSNRDQEEQEPEGAEAVP